MQCEETRYDIRTATPEERARAERLSRLMFELDHAIPGTPEYDAALRAIFGDRLGEGSTVAAPIRGTCLDRIVVGRGVVINANLLAMARGGIEIGDDVQIAANVQLITNNHDPYDRMVLTCRPIRIEEGAWIGAGATVLPGVRIGRHAIVGACAVVTRDVEDGEVVVGNPARAVRTLDLTRFA